MSATSYIYLIHFDQPYKHARHYIGSTKSVDERIAEHRTNRGARLMAVVNSAGITWRLARAWRGGRQVERRLKTLGGAARLCPICTPGTRWGAFAPAFRARRIAKERAS